MFHLICASASKKLTSSILVLDDEIEALPLCGVEEHQFVRTITSSFLCHFEHCISLLLANEVVKHLERRDVRIEVDRLGAKD